MTMTRLAVSGLRHRTGAFVATFLSAALGAAILMTFTAMIDTAAAPGVDPTSEEALITTASVAGGWCLLIVVFAVSSTTTLSVRQRDLEIGVLHRAGATRGQVRRMIVGEAVLVALAAAVVAVPLGLVLGRVLLELLRDTGQVAGSVGYAFGPVALSAGFGVTVLGAVAGALLAARRRTRAVPGRGRVVVASLFLLAGLACGVLTATVMRDKGMDAMQTAGQAGIWFTIGTALLSPWLLRLAGTLLATPLRLLAGAAGELAAVNVRQRAAEMSGAVMPVVLFTGITTATVTMQAIDDDASAGLLRDEVARSVQTLNYVVVGMIALFVAIMLVNTLLAATGHRRAEFARQRLAGATPAQVLGMVVAESVLLTATGVLAGTVASAMTIVPFGFARIGDALPPVSGVAYAVIVGVTVVLTFATVVGAARRAVAVRAVEAAGA